MTLRLLAEVSPQELVAGFSELHHHLLGYVKSMALKCAVDLGIPDAIHRRGGAATLAEIATDASVRPAKVADLRRVMELLSTTGIFTATAAAGGGGDDDAVVYRLTTACRFLVGSRNLSPVVRFVVSPLIVTSFLTMADWFRMISDGVEEDEAAKSLFEMAHGCSQWEMASKDPSLNTILNDSMAADSKLFLELVVADKGRIFRGLSSLVDVGGGHGAGTMVIAKAFPQIKCTVLDLPHVVSQAPVGEGNLNFIAGDMFQYIPPADAILLKNILHDWADEDCVKILERCKETIPARRDGGKVIIMEMVRGSVQGESRIHEMEAIQNLFMISINGLERDEHGWKKIFSAAGFSDYKIMPVFGPLSVMEIYP